MENEVSWHGKAPNEEEYEKALKELEGWKNWKGEWTIWKEEKLQLEMELLMH